jgi:hypothetical protein
LGPFLKKKIRLPKQKRLPHAIADAVVRKLLALTTNPIHRTCFALMYACGLRTGEAVSLEIPAIDGHKHLLTIIGKGNKERLAGSRTTTWRCMARRCRRRIAGPSPTFSLAVQRCSGGTSGGAIIAAMRCFLITRAGIAAVPSVTPTRPRRGSHIVRTNCWRPARDRRFVGGTVGILAVLHTWTQQLL